MARTVKPSDFSLYSMISEPSFSPDGSMVAFSSKKVNLKEDSYETEVFVADVAKRDVRPFTTGKKDSDPKWSPDGNSILFLSRRNLKKEDKGNSLFVVPSGGGEAKLLRRSEDGIEAAAWSPDSKEVYFLSTVTKKPKDDVKVIRRLTFWFNGVGFMYNKRKHLFKVNLGSAKVDQVTKGAMDLTGFDLSPDGRKVAYLVASDDAKPYISDVHLIDLRSKKKTKLTK